MEEEKRKREEDMEGSGSAREGMMGEREGGRGLGFIGRAARVAHSERGRGPVRLVTIYRSELLEPFFSLVHFASRPIGRNIQWECILLLLGAFCVGRLVCVHGQWPEPRLANCVRGRPR